MRGSVRKGLRLATVAVLAILPRAGLAADAAHPAVIELFHSQGCSDCPPAAANVAALSDRPDILALGFSVDYWDRLGWKDPFSSPQFTIRQQDYADRYSREGVYTPQLVVDGRFALVGSDSREANAAIQKAAREPKVAIALSNAARDGKQVRAHIDVPAAASAKKRSAVLYFAVADDHAESHVARGENAGRSLAHVAVTRVLKEAGTIDLGSASSKDVVLTLPAGAGASGLRLIAFLEDPRSGHILGATAEKL